MKKLRKYLVALFVGLMLNVSVLPTASVTASASKMDQVQVEASKSFAAISWAVGTTVVGVLKIAKIKKFIDAAGGVRKAANALVAIAKGGRSYANLRKFGHTLIDLSADVLGIKEIKDNCF